MDAPAHSSPVGRTRSQRIALTGITGQLGRHLVRELAAWPDTQILALVRTSSKPGAVLESVQTERVDFFDRNSLTATLRKFQPTTFIHAAATGMQQPRPPWNELIRFNVDVSVRLCELAGEINGCHFVHVSSGLAYREQGRALREEDPLDSQHPYAATKTAADVLVRATAAQFGLPLTVVRPFSFSGAGDAGSRLFPSLLNAASKRMPLELSPGDQVRDHCAVADVAHGIALAVARRSDSSAGPQIFNFGSGSTLALHQLVEGVVAELGLEVALNFGARPHTPHEPKFLVADTTRAGALLGWSPQTRFAHAVWQLARESFPELKVTEPKRTP